MKKSFIFVSLCSLIWVSTSALCMVKETFIPIASPNADISDDSSQLFATESPIFASELRACVIGITSSFEKNERDAYAVDALNILFSQELLSFLYYELHDEERKADYESKKEKGTTLMGYLDSLSNSEKYTLFTNACDNGMYSDITKSIMQERVSGHEIGGVFQEKNGSALFNSLMLQLFLRFCQKEPNKEVIVEGWVQEMYDNSFDKRSIDHRISIMKEGEIDLSPKKQRSH